MKCLFRFVLAITVVLAGAVPAVIACTSIRLQTTDGLVFYARTMEYSQPLNAGISVVPQGTAFVGTLPDGSSRGLAWKARHGFVGMNSFGKPGVIDGINDKGLVVGGQLFPGFAGYEPFLASKSGRTIAQYEVPTWLLSQFATVEEVRRGLPSVRVCQGPSAGQGVVIGPMPLHYTVHDASGASLVIEFSDGKAKVFDNPLGVLTNAPGFEWMQIFLSNAVNLSAINAQPLELRGIAASPLGQGSGMLGLPGDFTPPSRYLRMVALTQSVKPATGADAGLAQIVTVINNVDIPLGAVRQKTPQGEELELTQWVAVADVARGRYFFRTAENLNWRYVDVRAALDRAGKGIQFISIDYPAEYQNVSATGRPLQQ